MVARRVLMFLLLFPPLACAQS
ncbi:lytic transglycosylase domain-containing protein, partial [Pseudomonas aeruginosa]|nr:lytic transglycosylase domain-containing protein [Pseudomonas aeruginosa]